MCAGIVRVRAGDGRQPQRVRVAAPAGVVGRGRRHLDGVERQARRHEPELADDAESLAVDVRRDGQASGAVNLVRGPLDRPRRRAGEQRGVEPQHLSVLVGDDLLAEHVRHVPARQRCGHARVEHACRRGVGQQRHQVHLFLGRDFDARHRHAPRGARGAADGRHVVGGVVVADHDAVEPGLDRGPGDRRRVHVELPARR